MFRIGLFYYLGILCTIAETQKELDYGCRKAYGMEPI